MLFEGLRRIIGLDPAGPMFAHGDPFQLGMNSVARLNSSDAELVVCIHTGQWQSSEVFGGSSVMLVFESVDENS